MKNQNNQKVKKLNSITLVILPIAFLLFACLVAFIVNNIKSTIAHTDAIFNEAGIPLHWSSSINEATDIVSGVSAELVDYDEYFVQYNPYIKNTGSSEHYLTHLASYLTTTSGDGHGFVPLNESTVEYTYTPEDSNSWTHLAISAPGNTPDGFKLSAPLYLGPNGTPMSTIYFRYGISADTTHSDYLTDEVSFLVSDESKTNETLSVTRTALSYEAPNNSGDSVIATTDPADDSGGIVVRPLGVVSYVSNTDIIANVNTPDTDDNQASSMLPGQALVIILMAVFCSTILLYISFRQFR